MNDPEEEFALGLHYLDGDMVDKDEYKAFIRFVNAAGMGHPGGMDNVGYCYRYGIGVERDERKGFIHHLRSAKMGDANGTNNVGYCYAKGIGVEKNDYKAFEYFKKSAEMGDANATYHLGLHYLNGSGVEKDKYKAFIQFVKAAGMGHGAGMNNVGKCYMEECGVNEDERKAFVHFKKSAEMGHAEGLWNVGNCYQYGTGVKKNGYEALEYFKKSVEMGHVIGIRDIGWCYEEGVGVEKDECHAFIYYKKLSDMGFAEGMNNVGRCYLNGIGIEKNERTAFEYYKKSAEMNDITGINMVGYFYQIGFGEEQNVEEDAKKAVEYFKKTAEMNDANGLYMVGFFYSIGIGIENDEYKALEYYKKSAERGYAEGMSQVGYCYRNGIGTSINLEKANYWFKMEKNRFHEIIRVEYKDLDIDVDIKMLLDNDNYQLAWIPYEFKDIEMIGKGGFATVYKARLKRRHSTRFADRNDFTGLTSIFDVALKEFHENDYFNELKAYCEIGVNNPSFIKCYGITRNKTGNYILVLKYAKMGSLRKNFLSLLNKGWKDKLSLLFSIVSDLRAIHSQGIVHRDLHSGNILQDNLCSAYIADLGLSIQYLKQKDGRVYGILPYIAPEVFIKKQYTLASDIYSFGMIMWELLYGMPVLYDTKLSENELQRQIVFNNLRPTVNEKASSCYVNLMKKCWDKDSENRPPVEELCEVFKKWQSEEQILIELNEFKLIIPDHIGKLYETTFSSGNKLVSYINSEQKNIITQEMNSEQDLIIIFSEEQKQ